MHKPSDGCMEDSKAEHLLPCYRRSTYDGPLASYHSGSIISHLLRKTLHNKLTSLDNNLLYLPSANTSGLDPESSRTEDFAQDDHSCTSFKDEDLSVNEHLQAKRARVEKHHTRHGCSPNGSLTEKRKASSEDRRLRRDLLKEHNAQAEAAPATRSPVTPATKDQQKTRMHNSRSSSKACSVSCISSRRRSRTCTNRITRRTRNGKM
ncbi:hypothetical protein cypCar_00019473 [Cyprinus carpio]|nr:hypothetical protein cypCar_00019473 [Cyprinus carpio]